MQRQLDRSILETLFVLGRGEDKLTVRLVHLAESGWRWVEFEGCRNTVEAVVDKASSVTLLSFNLVVPISFVKRR